MRPTTLRIVFIVATAAHARADEPAQPAKADARPMLQRAFAGPFQSSRLYSMPAADTVGPYVLSLSGDGSLLQEPGLLTSAGVVAIGFGDIAQVEYRHTSAISVVGVNAPVPTLGVQLKAPMPERANVPAFAIALRFGVPRDQQLSGIAIDETVHDLFIVGRLRFAALSWLTLHGGLRVSPARIRISNDSFATDRRAGCELASPATVECSRTLWLPTGAYEVAMNAASRIVGEIALAPRFRYAPGAGIDPDIGYGLLGRLGVRWRLLPALILDASIGYQIDVAYKAATEPAAFGSIVNWDIRLGAEVFVPWGALACRAFGAFCG